MEKRKVREVTNFILHSHHELKGIDGEKMRESCERENVFQLRTLFGTKLNTTCMLLDQTVTTYCTKSVDIHV